MSRITTGWLARHTPQGPGSRHAALIDVAQDLLLAHPYEQATFEHLVFKGGTALRNLRRDRLRPHTLAPSPDSRRQLLVAETFTILGYPLTTVVAEKLSTAIELGDPNTRDRDYGDLYRLLRVNILRADEVAAALETTAAHRQITLRPLSSSITDLPQQRQPSYTHGYDAKAQPPTATQPTSRTRTRSQPSRTHSSTARLAARTETLRTLDGPDQHVSPRAIRPDVFDTSANGLSGGYWRSVGLEP